MNRTSVSYLTSYGVSLLGNSVTAIALPLLVLFTTGSPLGAGIVAIAAAVPSAVAGLLMGTLIDKINRRTAAILSDVISAVALLVLPIVDLTLGLSLGWFIAIAILNSFGDVPGITAREAMLPSVAKAAGIDPARLIGIREALGGAALLVGPAVAGFLVAALEPVSVLWITAGTAALAAVLTTLLPARATVHAAAEDDATTRQGAASVLQGLVLLFRSPLLRGLVLLSVSLGVVLAATQGLVIPVHFAFLDRPELVGLTLSALAAGLLVGGAAFASLGARLPRGAWFAIGLGLLTVGLVGLGLLGPTWSTLVAAAITGAGAGTMYAVVGLTFVENVDEAHRGKVLGAQNAVITLAPAVGIGGAALLIEVGSIGLAGLLLAPIWVVAAGAVLLDPRVRRLRGSDR